MNLERNVVVVAETRYQRTMSYHRAIAGTLLLCLAAATSPSPGKTTSAPCRPAGPEDRLRVDFDQVPLGDVVRFVSCAAQLDIILDPPSLAHHKVTIIAPRTVGVRDLVPLLQATLRHAGLITSVRGAYLLIRPDPAHVPSKRRSSKGR
ncbi:MAG: hypothetical protein QF464_07455 [Myxococcota bacterium]|nr:hypothetical protein [Myxococcota bacterium]